MLRFKSSAHNGEKLLLIKLLQILLKNKNTAEICDAIRVPFLYFYPDIDVSDIPCLQKLKDVTREGVARMQAQGMPNCHL